MSSRKIKKACVFWIGPENEFKKFKFGGLPEGTVQISNDGIALYKKSKVVRAAFGVIGSLVEGKGSAYKVITPGDVQRYEKVTNKKGVLQNYWVHLNDATSLYLCIVGGGRKAGEAAMDAFLSNTVQ